MANRAIILIDGGYLRVKASKAFKPNDPNFKYDPTFIEKFAHNCKATDEEILRILYYDCAPYSGTAKLPVSGGMHTFTGSDKWLEDLACRDLFAVRRGVLKFRGFKPKQTPVHPAKLTDADFDPDFEQKGVDMRIGLDIALYSERRTVERIILVSGDTDCVPAMKYGRRHGLQVVIIELPGSKPALELIMHSYFKRPVAWP
jgi:uncharacterized LabA/DUF88 family protein